MIKTHYLLYTGRKSYQNLNLMFLNNLIKEENTTKFLRIHVDNKLSWQAHINVIKNKYFKNL